MHNIFQALEIAVVHVCLHKFGARTFIHIAQSWSLESSIESRSILRPFPVRIRGAGKEGARAPITIASPRRVRDKAAFVRVRLAIIGKREIGWNPQIVRLNVREEGSRILVAGYQRLRRASRSLALPLAPCPVFRRGDTYCIGPCRGITATQQVPPCSIPAAWDATERSQTSTRKG